MLAEFCRPDTNARLYNYLWCLDKLKASFSSTLPYPVSFEVSHTFHPLFSVFLCETSVFLCVLKFAQAS
jgi:hypothetical protein